MKKPSALLRNFFAAFAMAGFVSATQALPIEFIDTYTLGTPVALHGTGSSHSFNHYIAFPTPATHILKTYIDGVLTPGEGYNAATDTLSDGTISLFFTGSSGAPPWTNGRFDLSLGGIEVLSHTKFATSIYIDDALFNVNIINAAGTLQLVVARTNAVGTAYFWGSTLNIFGQRHVETSVNILQEVSPVPAPATLALLGFGLLALGLTKRRLF